MEILFVLPRGYIQFPSFPTYRVSKRQLLTAISFPDVPASLELQLPNPSLATSLLNIEHNEHTFFKKQAFYTAPLKGTILTHSERGTCAVHLLIEKRGWKSVTSHIKSFTHIYWRILGTAHLPYKVPHFIWN